MIGRLAELAVGAALFPATWAISCAWTVVLDTVPGADLRTTADPVVTRLRACGA